MREHITAYTEVTPESYPGYISINREEDGKVEITVRERGSNGEKSVVLTMPDSAFVKLAVEALQRL